MRFPSKKNGPTQEPNLNARGACAGRGSLV